MTLLEMKKKVLRLIEEATEGKELTEDPDIKAKLNDVVNQVMFEVARMKKIPARETENVAKGEFDLTELESFYQLGNIKFKDSSGNEGDYEIFENFVDFPASGTATFNYYKYPKRITDDTEDEKYTFELSDDALEIVPYGVAADLLKSDVSNNYGQIYSQRYETMLQRLDSRYSTGSITFTGGY